MREISPLKVSSCARETLMRLDFHSLKVRPPTGEPDASDPPARFGGSGDRTKSVSRPLKNPPSLEVDAAVGRAPPTISLSRCESSTSDGGQ